MPKLFLHIGQPKTATTTIQNHLAMNRHRLLEDGWLYPNSIRQSIAHHPLANFFVSKPFYWIRPMSLHDSRMALLKEVRETGCDNIIMSTEALYYLRHPKRLIEWFEGFDVNVVVSLRRQDEWIESAYREQLKNGVVADNILKYLKQARVSLDYFGTLERWRAVLGEDRISVIPFEKMENNQSIETTFLECVGYSPSEPLRFGAAKNESLNRDALAFLSRLNEKPRIGERFQLYKTILAAYSQIHRDPPEYKYFYNPTIRASLVEEYSANNARVANLYLGNSDGILFKAPSPTHDEIWKPYAGLSAIKAVEIAEFLTREIYARLKKEM